MLNKKSYAYILININIYMKMFSDENIQGL